MQSYHDKWLEIHPERTKEWLQEKLLEGFDIHHVDGDITNEAYNNLVLIESADHLMLHNGKTRVFRIGPKAHKKPKPLIDRLLQRAYTKGKLAYEYRLAGIKWGEISSKLGHGYGTIQKYHDVYVKLITYSPRLLNGLEIKEEIKEAYIDPQKDEKEYARFLKTV